MKLTTTPLWVAVFVVGANVHSSLGQWVEWPVAEGGNGHWYRLTDVVGQWIDAEAEAASIGAHLVTINDVAENQWVFDTFAQPENLWIGLYQDVNDPDYAEPAGGWKWDSGETVSYTNWVSGEPNNNLGREEWAEMKGASSSWDGQWNDQIPNVDPPMRGIMEITDCNMNGIPDEAELDTRYFEDFESGAGPEWSSSLTDNTVQDPFTRFAGTHANDPLTLTLDLTPGVDYDLAFDLYIIDSWDGNGCECCGPDYFKISLDGTEVFRHTFGNTAAGATCQSYPRPADVGPGTYGWNAPHSDSIYREVHVSFTPISIPVLIAFQGEGLQEVPDETWGIDNVQISGPGANDCNNNGIPDECDITDGTSPDCQSDGIPDECQSGDENDCNTNGVPDECDPDFDGDGATDACDPDIDNDGVDNDLDECDNTPVGRAVDAVGHPLGDIDRDCDTDMADFTLFQQGFTGPLS